MSDNDLIAVAMIYARSVFKQPDLTFDLEHVFQDIRGFDSVRAVQFILALESALNIVLDEEDVDTMHTMGDMLATLRAKTRAMAREA